LFGPSSTFAAAQRLPHGVRIALHPAMIPLRDNIASQHFPAVNIVMITICGLVFLAQMANSERPGQPGLTTEYGMIPFRISRPGEPFEVPVDVRLVRTPTGIEQELVLAPAGPAAVPPLLTPLTCIFLHGGWMHVIGNLWFLWIFGDNVEDRLGHVGYVLFYLATGIIASLTHLLTDPASTIPTIGASGAIAGVMGAYFVWYPRSRVQTLVPIGPFLNVMEIPAPFFLGLWFVMQFVNGTMQGGGGVAWWAHIGGFVAGVAVALLLGGTAWLGPRRSTRPAPFSRRPGPWE